MKGNEVNNSTSDYSLKDVKLLSNLRHFIRFDIIKNKKSNILNMNKSLLDILTNNTNNNTKNNNTNKNSLSYESFKEIGQLVPEKDRRYFSAKNFLLLPKDKNNNIDRDDFLR